MEILLAVLFALLPTYLIRFHIGPLPTTVLEVMIWIIVITWLIKIFNIKYSILNIRKSITYYVTHNKLLFTGIALFLIGATISIFTSLDIQSALGEWKAFYVEPILVFLILVTTTKQRALDEQKNNIQYSILNIWTVNTIIAGLILCGLVTSILAIYQHFTGFGVPFAFWENDNSYRVTAWYGFPNAVGLFLAPLIPLAMHVIRQSYEAIKLKYRRYEIRDKKYISYLLSLLLSSLFIPAALLAIIFAKSTGSLIGILSGIFVLLLLYKKTRLPTFIACILGLLGFLSLPASSPIKQELLFQDRSGQIRIAIYKETLELLKDRPILGAGLASYSQRIEPYHTTVNGEGIEIFHHPHNIFLTMWVNTGIVGLVGFILILVWFYQNGFAMLRKNKLEIGNWKLEIPVLLASITTILVAGLVDSPYIKNDLAVLFWLLPALMCINTLLPQSESQSV